MQPRLRIALWIAFVGALAPMLAHAAVIAPPSEFLFKAEHAIVAGEVIDISEGGTLLLRSRETLHGNAPGTEVQVRTSSEWLKPFKRGDRVLVAYTLYRRSAAKPKTLEPRPGGPVILVSAGLEPALFRDTPTTRRLLAGKPDETFARSRAWLDAVLAGLRSTDLQVQNFNAAELALRPPLHALLKTSDRRRVQLAVDSEASHPSARAILINVAAAHPEHFGAGWAVESALTIVAGTSVTQADEQASLLPDLVRTSFGVLERASRDVPFDAARRWLQSRHVGLAEIALLAIRRSSPDRERAAAQAVLARPDLRPGSREFLRDHVRRLDIMQRSLDAAAGSNRDQGKN